MTGKQYFLYKLLPPRPDFAFTMSEEEAAVMAEHAAYWQGLLTGGTAVAFGPVVEPAGAWGLGLLEVDDPAEAEGVREGDPAVRSGRLTAEVHPMVTATVRPAAG
ncbi:YciI family protein [Blastococcus sp. SYSU D00695]